MLFRSTLSFRIGSFRSVLPYRARLQARSATVVTSDSTIRATVGGVPVTRLSSDVLVREVDAMDADVTRELRERSHQHLTLESRLDPATRAKLDRLLGRQ